MIQEPNDEREFADNHFATIVGMCGILGFVPSIIHHGSTLDELRVWMDTHGLSQINPPTDCYGRPMRALTISKIGGGK